MKHTRLLFAFALTSLVSFSAAAAPLTMLQFGSFETKAEAQKRLTEVTAKHSAFLGKLATNVREVKLPPDNLTVYRTQAGPVESRTAAQSICSQLASAGDECYIVQTAMVTAPEKAPSLAAAKTETLAPVAAAASSATGALAAVADDVTPTMPDMPDVTSKLSTLSGTNARDPLNRAALGTVGSGLGASSLTNKALSVDDSAMDNASSSVNKALDKAVSKETETDSQLSSMGTTSASPRTGFWSRLNPFSDDAPVKAPASVKEPLLAAAPVDDVVEKTLDDVAVILPDAPTLPKVAAPVIAAKAPEAFAAAVSPEMKRDSAKILSASPAAPAVVSLSRTPIKLDNTPVIMAAEPMRLPPPPAPLKAQDRAELAAGIKPRVAQPESIAVGPITTAAGGGSVQVEEAKRVPVTQDMAAKPVAAVAAPFARAQTNEALRPTATDGQKTIWAQVGPFSSEQAAIAYWTAYRQSHPDFPVVRVRATTPLQAGASNKQQSWLRVGPVANAGFVASLCSGLVAQQGLRCGAVRDAGVASPLKAPTSRYKR